ncbi:nitrite reductase small subunit NirD [Vallicoccus soli]|uniref:Nitrite reductase (NAD(P)H) small subunit n=1 Tax=Vallicoccus soli TaxID=2339232 RepID=A0A3A3Z284_9ACTN|nr:nitrite reductase small subunit NirD [Vallicoccus soli]RJK96844.1 nitrite reductase (NAD(P)H) small subunit [Vallicoccus soli]
MTAVAERLEQDGTEVGWVPVCPYDALVPDRGAAAIVDGDQVALFRTADGAVHAVGNRDPFSGANVLARGIVGGRGDVPTVASPMYKQAFDLRTGRCLDDAAVALPVWRTRVRDGLVEVLAPGRGRR